MPDVWPSKQKQLRDEVWKVQLRFNLFFSFFLFLTHVVGARVTDALQLFVKKKKHDQNTRDDRYFPPQDANTTGT